MNAVGPNTLRDPSRTLPGKRGAQNHHFSILLSDPNSTVVTDDPIHESQEPLRRTFSLPVILLQHMFLKIAKVLIYELLFLSHSFLPATHILPLSVHFHISGLKLFLIYFNFMESSLTPPKARIFLKYPP